MTNTKPVILTNFGYQRKNWIQPLESLRDEFEIVYIHYNDIKDEKHKFTESTTLYFSDFQNAQHLIDTIQPKIFIAMGLNSNNIFAIKHVCNKRNIPFVYMDHGLYGIPSDYKLTEKEQKIALENKSVVNEDELRTRNFKFALNTFLCSFAITKILAILLITFYRKLFKDDGRNTFIYRYLAKPDAYLTYTKLNNILNQQYFSPQENQIHYIGNFEYDKFKITPQPSDESYLLLIDSPMSDNPFKRHSITINQHLNVYKKINSLAIEKGLKLKIKLHPYNYKSEWVLDAQHTNIEFIKDFEDINSLIKNAKFCVSFYSTLLVPAICYVPTAIIKLKDHSFIEYVSKKRLCTVYDIENLDHEKINFLPVVAHQDVEYREDYFNSQNETSDTRLRKSIKNIISSIQREPRNS